MKRTHGQQKDLPQHAVRVRYLDCRLRPRHRLTAYVAVIAKSPLQLFTALVTLHIQDESETHVLSPKQVFEHYTFEELIPGALTLLFQELGNGKWSANDQPSMKSLYDHISEAMGAYLAQHATLTFRKMRSAYHLELKIGQEICAIRIRAVEYRNVFT